MKKIIILALPTLIIWSIINPATSVFAAIEDRGTTWWSVEELLEFYQEVELEKSTECRSDLDCEIEFNFNMVERGPKYSALNNLLEAQVWVTSINPTKETVKVLFFGEDMMLRWMGVEEALSLEHLYIGWVENWNGQIYNYSPERFLGGSIEGNHVAFVGNYGSNADELFPAWEEVELSVEGSELRNNPHGKLDYAAFAEDNMFNAQGYFDYSSCLKSPDYGEGVECKLMISGDQWATYLPPREQMIDTSDKTPPDVTFQDAEYIEAVHQDASTAEPTLLGLTEDIPIENALNDTLIPVKEVGNDKDQDSTKVIAKVEKQEEDSIKAPNTGAMAVKADRNKTMPWWIVAMEILGVALVLWWFFPTRTISRKKRQKSAKKSTKTLDKKSHVR